MTDSVLVLIDPLLISDEEVEKVIRKIGYKVVRIDSSFR